MDYLHSFVRNVIHIWLEAAPWLFLGLLIAGLIRASLSMEWMSRWLGGRGLIPVIKAAVLGTPLPLCSCSVLPVAIALRRGGASRGATVSFLIATPENGADSIAVSYALLGPVMTVARLVAALTSAVVTGQFAEFVSTFPNSGVEDKALARDNSANTLEQRKSGTGDIGFHTTGKEPFVPDSQEDCCADNSSAHPREVAPTVWNSLVYSFSDLLADIALWMLIGVLAAAAIATFISPEAMAEWGSGLGAMLAILLIGVPMYICATASTPVAASMLVAGVSPGTVLVFLLAGPATNLASLGIVRREVGWRAAAAYLIGISLSSVALGLALDQVVAAIGWNINMPLTDGVQMVPGWLAWAAGISLPIIAIGTVINKLRKH